MYLGHSLDQPPGSQPNLQRIQRLRSALDLGSHIIESKDTYRQQLESSLEFRLCWRLFRFCCGKCRLVNLNTQVSRSLAVDDPIFQSEILDRRHHWCSLVHQMYSSRQSSGVSSSRCRKRKENCTYRMLSYSDVEDGLDRWSNTLVSVFLPAPQIHLMQAFCASTRAYS